MSDERCPLCGGKLSGFVADEGWCELAKVNQVCMSCGLPASAWSKILDMQAEIERLKNCQPEVGEFSGNKYLTIEQSHVGMNAYTPQFVDWLSESFHEAEDEIERLKKILECTEVDHEAEPTTVNDYLALLSAYIVDVMPTVPGDEYFGAWERLAKPILERLIGENER